MNKNTRLRILNNYLTEGMTKIVNFSTNRNDGKLIRCISVRNS